MRDGLLAALAAIALLLAHPAMAAGGRKCDAVYGDGANHFSLATGSPGELGILGALGAAFAKANDASLCWIK